MPDTEEAIVRRAQRGDAEAFHTLFERFRDPIYHYVRQMVGEADLAADLTQDTFLSAYRALPRLKAPGAFRGWLYRIAINRVRDHCKRPRMESLYQETSGVEEERQIPDPAPGPEGVLVQAGLRVAVEKAVAALEPDRREVVILHHLQGMDVRAIARLLGIAEGTVKSRLGRARTDLRRRLADWMEEE